MNTLRLVRQTRRLLAILVTAFSLGTAVPSFATVVVSSYADGPTWNGTPVILTTATPQTALTVNQQVTTGTSLVQTIRTGASGFKLDKLDLYSGGQGGATVRLNIYPDPVGGEDADGFVNTSFSTDLLNGGAGLEFTIGGSPGLRYVRLDLTGADEITLDPNQQYAIELDVTGGNGQFSWYRSTAGTYPDGNLYSGGTESGFNGTAPANNRGLRTQVGGTPQRDAGLALFRQDGVTVTNRTDAAAWPGSPAHTTTGAADLQATFNTEVTLNAAQPAFSFPGGAATQTFTPTTTFKLDKFMLRVAGGATTGEMYLYQNVNGGSETDGFVNVSQSDATLLAAMPFTFDGTPTRSLLEFDLLGNNEITLQAGVEYAIDIRNTGTNPLFWMRDEDPYSGGNIYNIDVDTGTERHDVAGDGKKDGALALYAAAAGLPGDFNNDGKVDSADYATWRKNSANASLPNDGGAITQAARYTLWRSNFGTPSGAGTALSGGAVPEPGTALLRSWRYASWASAEEKSRFACSRCDISRRRGLRPRRRNAFALNMVAHAL